MPGVRPVSVAETAVAVEPVSGEGVAATVGGESSTTRLLSVSATKTSPAASTATLVGRLEPGADGQDGAVGQDLLDGVVAGVGDEDVAGRVHRHAGRVAEPGADGQDGAVWAGPP